MMYMDVMAGDKTTFYNTEKFMRDFNDCMKPFMDMRITTHKAGDYYINPEENLK